MTPDKVMELLLSGEEIGYDVLDEMFAVFGFHSELEIPDSVVYYHSEHINCGSFRARDPYGWAILTPGQRSVVLYMLRCVEANEKRKNRP